MSLSDYRIDNVGDYLYLTNGSFKFEVDPHQFNLRLQHFSQFPFNEKKSQKNLFHAAQKNNNKSSNHSLIEKNTEIIVFEHLHFILLLSANYLPAK